MAKTMTEDIELSGERTKLYPITLGKAKELDHVTSEKIMKWRTFCAKWRLHVEDYYGKPIHYEGILFEGSPLAVFWGRFIEPFLENGIVGLLEEMRQECLSKNLEPRGYLNEAAALLRLWVAKTYQEMVRTDQVLRGKGYPDSIRPVDVSSKISQMNDYINSHVTALLHREETVSESKASSEILEIKPNLYGIGINFNELLRRMRIWIKKRM